MSDINSCNYNLILHKEIVKTRMTTFIKANPNKSHDQTTKNNYIVHTFFLRLNYRNSSHIALRLIVLTIIIPKSSKYDNIHI